jgi:hypothetical protein
MTGAFAEHLALFQQLLAHRRDIVQRIEQHLLNVQGKDTSRRRDRPHFDQLLNTCFFALPGLPAGSSRLKGQLAARHVADGFEPIALDRYSHELDPLELILRAYHHWDRHRWPGRSGRLTFAHTIYAAFMLRQLEGLSLRIWDDGSGQAPDRLDEIQRLLDDLTAPPSEDVFVRDARWLVHTAQGPLTRYLAPYFKVADQIAVSFTGASRLGLHQAGARLAGGHLRSQLRYRMWETDRPASDPEVLAVTRNSNSMDGALLVRDLVPLLEAYESAGAGDGEDAELELADGILQGLSSDPELLLTRLDLLAPLTTIEELFVTRDASGRARFSSMGEAHGALIERYSRLIGRLAAPLRRDAEALDPVQQAYSPFGVVYGFAADVLSNMAHSRLLGQPFPGLTLEDLFVSRGRLDDKLALARRWEKLPTKEGEREHFAHSLEWANEMFARLTSALDDRAGRPGEPNASGIRTAHLLLASDGPHDEATALRAQEYFVTSDPQLASASGATLRPKSQILIDRQEGRFLASCESNGYWFAISKVPVTTMVSQGKDAAIAGVPPALLEILRLTSPDLLRGAVRISNRATS